MSTKKASILLLLLVASTVILLAAGDAVGQETVLYSFGESGTSVDDPGAGPIMDAAGNLYSITWTGGAYNRGAVFELSPATGGQWKLKVLHSFNPSNKDGYYPSGLVLDAAGDLYGTTQGGGAYSGGTAYEMVHSPNGGFSEKILHSFKASATDGIDPFAGLTLDAAGNLYGTTGAGGAHTKGTVSN